MISLSFTELDNRKKDIEKELSTLDDVVDSNISEAEEKIMKEYYEVSLEKDNLSKEIRFKEKEKDKEERREEIVC